MLTPTVEEALTAAFTQDDAYSNAAVWQSLHSANPGTTGTSEVTTGTGVYARQCVTFSGSSGTDTNVGAIVFEVATGESVSWIGFWTAETGGTFLGGFPTVKPYKGATALVGNMTVECPGHGLSVGLPVRMYPLPGLASSAIAAPVTADTVYYVNSVPSADQITLVEPLSSPITFSSSGAFMLAQDLSQDFPSGGIATFPANTGVAYQTASA